MKLQIIKRGLAIAMSALMFTASIPVMAEETASTESWQQVEMQEEDAGEEAEKPEMDDEDSESKEESEDDGEKSEEKEEESDGEKSEIKEDTETDDEKSDSEDAKEDDDKSDSEDAEEGDDKSDSEDAETDDEKSETEEEEITDREESEAFEETEELEETEVFEETEIIEEIEEIEVTAEDEVIFNTGSCEVSVYKLDGLPEDEEYEEAEHFDQKGNYTIEIPEKNPYFPYEVQFQYDGKTTEKWFMTPDDKVEIGDYTFYVDADFDNTEITQMSLKAAGKKVIVYPERKKFRNDAVMETSLLPLEERDLTVDLTGLSPLELTRVAVSDVFTGSDKLSDTSKIAWKVKYSGHNQYTIDTAGGTLDMSLETTWGSVTFEMITGSADQLDASDIRYMVDADRSKSKLWLAADVYEQDEAGVRTQRKVEKNYYYDDEEERWLDVDVREVSADAQEVYLSLTPDTDTFKNLSSSNIKVYEGKYTSAEQAESGIEITDKILASDMTAKDAGYKIDLYAESSWITMVLYQDGKEAGCLPFDIWVNTDSEESRNHIGSPSISVKRMVNNDNYSYSYTDYLNYASTQTMQDGIQMYEVELYKEYPADGQYNADLNYYIDGSSDSSTNAAVTAAYVGNYQTIAQAKAAGAENIKDKLFALESYDGYTADYSQGILFTIFVGEDGTGSQEIYRINIKTKTGSLSKINLSSDTLVKFTGLKDAGNSGIDVYCMENTEDSYSEHNFITILADENTDITNVAPIFKISDGIHLYTEGSSEPEKSGESYHDFSKGALQYTAVAENGEDARNYWVQVIPAATAGRLYVNSLEDQDSETHTENGVIYSKRKVVIDSYHEDVHDIVFANMGMQAIPNLKAELVSNTLELDSYWTLTGEYGLAGFAGVEGKTPSGITSTYGELSNLAKVRLLAKKDVPGEVDGTLTIKSGSKTLMVLELTGSIGDVTITTKELPAAVKYVPYGSVIQNNNQYSWNTIGYEISSGSLPAGMELKKNGELYGVPKESGEFTFIVKMSVSNHYRSYVRKEFTLVVKDNTNANVDSATDPGYEVSTRLPDIEEGAGEDQLFVSQGEYADFQSVYLDGAKLTEGREFVSEAGSTRITILAETVKKLSKGTHTLGVEFRTKDDTLKKAAQNFGVGTHAGSDGKDDGSTGNGNAGNGNTSNGSIGNGNKGEDNKGGNSSQKHSSKTKHRSNISGQGNSIESDAGSADGWTGTWQEGEAFGDSAVLGQTDVQGLSCVNVVTDPMNAKIEWELLQNYYGQNDYFMMYLGNGIGYSMAMPGEMPAEEMDLSAVLEELPDFAENFYTFHVNPLNHKPLPWQISVHVNVGIEYAGRMAYIFVYDEETNTYVIKNIMLVNEIGNIMADLDHLTDVMILIEQ